MISHDAGSASSISAQGVLAGSQITLTDEADAALCAGAQDF
jgi:hypothetical protein